MKFLDYPGVMWFKITISQVTAYTLLRARDPYILITHTYFSHWHFLFKSASAAPESKIISVIYGRLNLSVVRSVARTIPSWRLFPG